VDGSLEAGGKDGRSKAEFNTQVFKPSKVLDDWAYTRSAVSDGGFYGCTVQRLE
jgi:hypothetical protein